MERYEMSVELYKLKALVSCLEDKLEKADIFIDEKGEHVFCLVDILREHIDSLIDNAGNLKEGVA